MVFRQSLDNARQAPLKLSVDGEAVNQQHRLALALEVVVDFDAVGVERAFLARPTPGRRSRPHTSAQAKRGVMESSFPKRANQDIISSDPD